MVARRVCSRRVGAQNFAFFFSLSRLHFLFFFSPGVFSCLFSLSGGLLVSFFLSLGVLKFWWCFVCAFSPSCCRAKPGGLQREILGHPPFGVLFFFWVRALTSLGRKNEHTGSSHFLLEAAIAFAWPSVRVFLLLHSCRHIMPRRGWLPAPVRASHESPRTQTCSFQGPGLQKHHQNPTRRPPRERQKERKWEGGREVGASARCACPNGLCGSQIVEELILVQLQRIGRICSNLLWAGQWRAPVHVPQSVPNATGDPSRFLPNTPKSRHVQHVACWGQANPTCCRQANPACCLQANTCPCCRRTLPAAVQAKAGKLFLLHRRRTLLAAALQANTPCCSATSEHSLLQCRRRLPAAVKKERNFGLSGGGRVRRRAVRRRAVLLRGVRGPLSRKGGEGTLRRGPCAGGPGEGGPSAMFYLGQFYLGQVYLGQAKFLFFSDFGHLLLLCVVCCVLCVVVVVCCCCVLCVVCCCSVLCCCCCLLCVVA